MNTENNSRFRSYRPFRQWLKDQGFSAVTGWRMRKRGMVEPVNISGRLYLSEEAIQQFHERAERGEFAKKTNFAKTQC